MGGCLAFKSFRVSLTSMSFQAAGAYLIREAGYESPRNTRFSMVVCCVERAKTFDKELERRFLIASYGNKTYRGLNAFLPLKNIS